MKICDLLTPLLTLACSITWQIAPVCAQESRLGRLFFAPEERQRFDQRRGTQNDTANAPQTVMVNGVIIRPGMAPILFLDGKEIRQGEGPAGVRLAPQVNQSVQMQADGGPAISARPGQIVDLSSGRTIENYQLTTPPPTVRAAPRILWPSPPCASGWVAVLRLPKHAS
jgi:hypothetical protein